MADLIEVPFSGGTITFAAPGTRGPQAYTAATVVERASETLEKALEMVKSMAAAIGKQISEIDCAGAEATFGLSVTGKGRFIVAEASAESSIEIKLTFKRP